MFEPAQDFSVVIAAGKGDPGEKGDLFRPELQADGVIEKEVVEEIGADMVLGDLADLAVFVGGEKLGGDGG